LQEEKTTEELLDVLHEDLGLLDSTEVDNYDISFSEDPNVPAIKITQTDDQDATYVLVTSDVGSLPYYIDVALEFETPDAYLVCWYNDDPELEIDWDQEDRNHNRSFIAETVIGMDNIAEVIRGHFLTGWVLNQANPRESFPLEVGQSVTLDELKEIFPEEDGHIFIGWPEEEEKLTEGDIWDYFKGVFDDEAILMSSVHTGGGCHVMQFVHEDDADWHEEQLHVWVTPWDDVFRGANQAEVYFQEVHTYTVGCYIGEESGTGDGSITKVTSLKGVADAIRMWLILGK
jgi:hypothetical protein